MKRLSLSILFLVFATAGFSQFEIGPRVGLGTAFTDVSGTTENIKSGDAEFGFSVGLFTRFGSDRFKVMPELLYSTTTTNVVFNQDGTGDQILDSELNKIDIPVNLQLSVIDNFLNLSGGVVGSYLVENSNGVSNSTEEAIKNYKDFTFGFQAGAGLELGTFLIDVKYESNLSDLSNSNSVGGVNFDERQQMVKALLGIKLF